MSIEEKFAVYEFRESTTLSLQEVGQAAQESMGVSNPLIARPLKFVDADETGFDIQLNSLIGLEIGRWRVSYSGEQGQAQVQLEIVAYSVEQEKFLFIPVGPKTSGALKPFKKFSQHFHEALTR